MVFERVSGGATMSIEPGKKQGLIGKFKIHEGDTGSPEVQIAILSARIDRLNEHFGIHKKDHSSRLGLLRMVERRRSLLSYLKRKNLDRYQRVLSDLSIRK